MVHLNCLCIWIRSGKLCHACMLVHSLNGARRKIRSGKLCHACMHETVCNSPFRGKGIFCSHPNITCNIQRTHILEMCGIVTSYRLVKAVNSSSNLLTAVQKGVNDTLEYWVSQCSVIVIQYHSLMKVL